MKKRIIAIAVAGVLRLGSLPGVALNNSSPASNENSFIGIVGDITCGREHSMMPGMTDAQCTRQCVAKLGSKYALATQDKVYVLEGRWEEVDELAGRQAKVTGNVERDTIKVSKIEKL